MNHPLILRAAVFLCAWFTLVAFASWYLQRPGPAPVKRGALWGIFGAGVVVMGLGMWFLGVEGGSALIVGPAFVLAGWLSVRTVWFCDRCGTYHRAIRGSASRRCRACGFEVVEKRL